MKNISKKILLSMLLSLGFIAEQSIQARMSGLGAGFLGAGAGLMVGNAIGRRSARRDYGYSNNYYPRERVIERHYYNNPNTDSDYSSEDGDVVYED